MKRHLSREITAPTLSVEEEAILIDEQNQAVTEIEQTIADDQRVTETKEILTDAETALAEAPEVGDVETSLATAVADMAVAGTDANPDELVPTVPSAEVATESFVKNIGERLKKIWEEIKAFLLKIWNKIKEFFRNIAAFFGRTDKKGKALEEQLKEEKESKSTTKGLPFTPNKHSTENTPEVRERGSIMRSIYALTRGTDYDLTEASKAHDAMDLDALRRIEKELRDNPKSKSTPAAAAPAPEIKPTSVSFKVNKEKDKAFEFFGSKTMLCIQHDHVLKGTAFTKALADTRHFMHEALFTITEHTLLQMQILTRLSEDIAHSPQEWRAEMSKYGKLYSDSQRKMLTRLQLDPGKKMRDQKAPEFLGGVEISGGEVLAGAAQHEGEHLEWLNDFRAFQLHMVTPLVDIDADTSGVEPLPWQEGSEVRKIQKAWSEIANHRDTQQDLKELVTAEEKMMAALEKVGTLKDNILAKIKAANETDNLDARAATQLADESDLLNVYRRIASAAKATANQATIIVRLIKVTDTIMFNAVEYAGQSSKWRAENGINAT